MLIILILFLLVPISAFAHEGHNHAAAPDTSANLPAVSISLASGRRELLDIKTTPARLDEVARTVRFYGRVKALPERQAVISPRFSARVLEVLAQAGQHVAKNAVMARIEPLVLGSTSVEIRSPIDGVVTGNVPMIGQPIQPSDTLFEIIDLSEVLIVGQVYAQSEFDQLKIGQSAQIASLPIIEKFSVGRVERLDPSIDEKSRGRNIYIKASNADARLLKNMLVNINVAVDEPIPAILVPRAAILGRDSEPFLFVKVGDIAERRPVKLGMLFGNEQEIISGILPDEEIIVQGHYQLQFAPSVEK